VRGNSCPNTLTARNLGSQLRATGHSFAGYAEGLPRQGWTGCSAGAYARKHVPWVNFTNLPASVNRPLTAFPTRFRSLPTLSFVIPDLDNDMHDGSVATGDRWVRDHLGAYARWAKRHDSLLLVTFDEDDYSADNHIATIAYGARVRTGARSTRIDHCRVLRTLESLYGLAPLGCAAGKPPIKTMWRR
jgi:acid phosphatase